MLTREEKSKKITDRWEKEEKHERNKKRIIRLIKIFTILFFLILGSFCYMRFVGTKGLVVREYRVENDKLPESFHGLKVVHFSDLHYNTIVHEAELKKIVKQINDLEPDFVFFTGDLTDPNTTITEDDQQFMIEQLNNIEATLGMYAVRGNHDYGTNTFDVVFTQTNFKILDNNYDLVYAKGMDPILLIGFASKRENDFDLDQDFGLPADNNYYTIALFHEPDCITDILTKYPVSLAVSGHSHNGQVRLPFIGSIFKVEGSEKYSEEYYKVENTDLYISGGLGTSLYKLRLFNHPSMNFYRLVNE